MSAPTLPIGIAAAVLLATGAAAFTSQGRPADLPGQLDTTRVAAGTYAVDGAHTLVQWSVDHFGFNPYFGLFGDVEGTLTIDPANLAGATVDVTIPVTSLSVVSGGLREHLFRPGADGARPDFFGPEPAPARFRSTSVQPTGARDARIHGELTLNGVTRPLAIDAQFTGAGDNPMNRRATVGFTGTAVIKRSDFGLTYALPLVGDEVELAITAAFERR
ncbi:YceI family protein [Erythrobacteraceae bacterium CFH 75059]|uniref:YceI family protein n=1 Tax=Qipengyuania thermophila TaxID=2509361 RepID=UPI00101F4ADC|nr:YceI family protein [Qipengyuania thermophila]TCD05107.1 YceI family protein [Erythrobacteraceae bacterium CFH 75059]